MAVSKKYWNKKAGVLRPFKREPMLLDVLVPVLKSLDLRSDADLRDALLFTISFVCGARAREMVNLTWGDLVILGEGSAVKIDIRPFKTSSFSKSTHSCQVGRRTFPQVGRVRVGRGGVTFRGLFLSRHWVGVVSGRGVACVVGSHMSVRGHSHSLPFSPQICVVEQVLQMGKRQGVFEKEGWGVKPECKGKHVIPRVVDENMYPDHPVSVSTTGGVSRLIPSCTLSHVTIPPSHHPPPQYFPPPILLHSCPIIPSPKS